MVVKDIDLESYYFRVTGINDTDIIISLRGHTRLYEGSIGNLPRTLHDLINRCTEKAWKGDIKSASALSYFYNVISTEGGFNPIHDGDVECNTDYDLLMDNLFYRLSIPPKVIKNEEEEKL